MTNTQIVHTLQQSLIQEKCDGVLLPLTDEYQNEYSAPYARRVTWLTGFDGSAGMVVVLHDRAALLTDGRYTLQATREVDTSLFEVYNSATMNVAAYLNAYAVSGAVIGYDPWLHSARQIESLEKAIAEHVTLTPLSRNPIDTLWHDQPPRPTAPIFVHDEALAGRSSVLKIADVTAKMTADALLLTEPDAICWLLNIRGGDVPYNPLPLCYAIVEKNGAVTLIIHPDKVPAGILAESVHIADERVLLDHFASFLQGKSSLNYDPATCPIWFVQQAESADIALSPIESPVTLLKSVKNSVEQDNIRRAHAVDGVAVKKFLRWFDALPPDASLTEMDVVEQLEAFRLEHPDYRGASFATIAGAGEHGAIVHYRANPATNRAVEIGDALLVDSGGQYPYGTTDITRTLFRGDAPAHFKQNFTLVLKGHIALATAIFPEGTTGHQLDVLARQFLWAEGLDYQHGTGHGVGHYLCVHEGPQNISTRAGGAALQTGMILSNEPGYYAEGKYGIRIESLVLVVEKTIHAGKRFLGFETLTRAPIDKRLVDVSLMTEREWQWLTEYNQISL
jgi:Xaa-Pro aminopeptidase